MKKRTAPSRSVSPKTPTYQTVATESSGSDAQLVGTVAKRATFTDEAPVTRDPKALFEDYRIFKRVIEQIERSGSSPTELLSLKNQIESVRSILYGTPSLSKAQKNRADEQLNLIAATLDSMNSSGLRSNGFAYNSSAQ